MSRNLTVHYQRRTYLVVPSPETLGFAGRRVRLYEAADGQVEIHCGDHVLTYSLLDKQPLVTPGTVVENKRLGAVLSVIRAGQGERDEQLLASKKLTLRQKTRLRAKRAEASRVPESSVGFAPAPGGKPDRLGEALAATQGSAGGGSAMAIFLAKFTAEQKA